MGSRPIEGYHLCSSEFLAIADHDIVQLKILNYTISEKKKVTMIFWAGYPLLLLKSSGQQ